MFSAGLALSTLLSGTVSAESNMNTKVTTNAGSRWNKEKVKVFLKKSVPYVAVGVPSAALLIGLAAYAYKTNSNEKNVQQPNSNPQPNADANSVQSQSTHAPVPRTLSSSDIDKYEQEGMLPGIKLWKVNNSWLSLIRRNFFYFYTITDLPSAKRYFCCLGIKPGEREIILKWQNHSICEQDFDKIFGNGSAFRNAIVRLKDQEKIEDYSQKSSNQIKNIKQSGIPVLQPGMNGYCDMINLRNQEACKHINEKLNVTDTDSVAKTPNKALMPKSSSEEKSTQKDTQQGTQSAQKGTQNNKDVLVSIVHGDDACGSTGMNHVRESLTGELQSQLGIGCLPGFRFYRYKPSGFIPHGTRHCYIITDYKLAKATLGGIDDTEWRKIVLYQNRWLSKKDKKGWSFENIFGFKEGTFGGYFNKITQVDVEKRQGSETLLSDRAGKGNWGDSVFSKNSKELEVANRVLLDEAMRCITLKSTDYDSFIQKIKEIEKIFIK